MDSATDLPARAGAALGRTRDLFLDEAHAHGCAETALVVLKAAFGLRDAANPAAAMALNGGIAYSGGTCGAITGAAVAVGELVASRVADHVAAKRTAREIVAGVVDAFETEFGSLDCRTLIGRDIRTPEAHQAFIESGLWRSVCLRQLEFVVGRLAPLAGDPRLAVPDPRGLPGGPVSSPVPRRSGGARGRRARS